MDLSLTKWLLAAAGISLMAFRLWRRYENQKLERAVQAHLSRGMPPTTASPTTASLSAVQGTEPIALPMPDLLHPLGVAIEATRSHVDRCSLCRARLAAYLPALSTPAPAAAGPAGSTSPRPASFGSAELRGERVRFPSYRDEVLGRDARL